MVQEFSFHGEGVVIAVLLEWHDSYMQANPHIIDLHSHLQSARVNMPHYSKGERLAVAFLSKDIRTNVSQAETVTCT